MGYFRQLYNLSKDPVTGGYDTTGTIVFGFCIVLSPIGVPLFYIGRVAQKIMEDRDG